MQQKLILFYEIEKEKLDKIEQICKKLNFRTKKVAKAFYLEKIGFLISFPGWKKQGIRYEKEGFKEEMIVFSGLDSNDLDKFLDEYQKEGLEPITLKAVVTEYNKSWTSVELFQELQRERKQVNQ